MPKPPFKLVDNQETWLGATDIVSVDAMGTGFSRPTAEAGNKFYGVQGDLDGFGRFIETYLTKYKRYGSPVFLAGESYGGIRTAGLSNWLINRGVALNGAIIISGVENEITLRRRAGKRRALHRLSAKLLRRRRGTTSVFRRNGRRASMRRSRSVEKFTLGEYASALAAGATPSSDAETASRCEASSRSSPGFRRTTSCKEPPPR